MFSSGARRSEFFILASLAGFLLVSVYVDRSSAFSCDESGMLLSAIYTHHNESLRQELGFNTTFVLLAQNNGSTAIQYPWTDPKKFHTELNFTHVQWDSLKNLSLVTNSSRVGVHYSCNITTLNCTVFCTVGEGEGLGETGQSGGFCGEGTGLELLRQDPNITSRWFELCGNVTGAQDSDPSPVYMDLINGNQTLFCEFNTTVPIMYNVTLWEGGVNTTTAPCVQNGNLTVMCYVEVNVTGIRNVSDVICTISSPYWPVRLTGYQFDDEYYEYYEDDVSGEDWDDGKVEFPVIFKHAQLRGGPPQGGNGPNSDLGSGGSTLLVVAVVACVGLLAVSVGLILRRRRSGSPGVRRVVYRPQSGSPYHPEV